MFRAESPARPTRARSRSTVAWHADELPTPTVWAPALLATAAGIVAMWPYTSVIRPGEWSLLVLVVIVAVALSGMIARLLLRRRSPGVAAIVSLVVQLLVATAVVTQHVSARTALFGVIPTSDTLAVFAQRGAAAIEEITYGAAPLKATAALAAVLGAAFVVVAIALDQLIAQRTAVLPLVLTGVVGAVPMIVTLGDANLVWFVLFAVLAIVLLLWSGRRHPLSPRRSSAAVATGLGAAAVALALVITPALPLGAGLTGNGPGITVDASLRLGDDLRQPNPVEVLTVAATGDTAPYLRLTTLSRFDGSVWQPDRGDLQAQSEGFGDAEWGDDIAVAATNTSIRVLRMSSSWLPVPYPATGVQGLPRAWRVMPDNRTIVSRNTDAVGADYTVSSVRVTPTLEQVRAVDAAPPVDDPETADVEVPEIVGDLAREVTADAATDYDRLIALQEWFRTEFTYSLDTPVDEGFDGTGAEAVAQFLDVRSGYCVHFAGSFALMAESLGMQTRIVVGYLPGTRTNEKRGDETIFSVTSDRLHSWPEVLFPGIGWIPFEPTASLGVPTEFRAATVEGGGSTGPSAPTQTTAPQEQQTAAPEVERDDVGGGTAASADDRSLDPTPILAVVLGAVVVVLMPALVRALVRAGRLRRARRGDAVAAWTELRDALVDLRLPVSDAESPRRRGAELVRERHVDADAMRALVTAIEQSAYARSHTGDGADLAAPLRDVLSALHRSVDAPSRLRAVLVPRSLFAARMPETAAVD